MTAAGRLETKFETFKKEVEKRLTILENNAKAAENSIKTAKKIKSKDILLETKNNEIVASDVE